jgi:CBS domain-containing protein
VNSVFRRDIARSIGEFCNRSVVVAERNCSVLDASRLMRQHHVGALVIVVSDAGMSKPVGLVTDRDLVVEVIAAHLDPAVVLIGDIMVEPLCLVREQEGVFETMRLMREHGVRRVPVVDGRGGLQGIIAIDDLIAVLADEMNEFARLITHEQVIEFKRRK